MDEQNKNDDLEIDPLSEDLDLSMDELDLAPLEEGESLGSPMEDLAPSDSTIDASLDELDLSPAEESPIDELDLAPLDETEDASLEDLDLSLDETPSSEASEMLAGLEASEDLPSDLPSLDESPEGEPETDLALDLDGNVEDLAIDLEDDTSVAEAAPGFAGEEDEEVTLSADELDNILNTSDDSLFEDMDETKALPEGIDPEDHALELAEVPKDDIPDLEPLAPESAGVEASPPASLDLEGDDDEPIALSADELDNILEDVDMEDVVEGEAMQEEELPDLELEEPPAIPDAKDSPALQTGADDLDADIALSDDELSEVLLDDSTEAVSEEIPETPSLASLEMDDDDDSIALTPEELGNIVSEVDTDEVIEAEGQTPDEELVLDEEPLLEVDESEMPVVDGAPPEGIPLDSGGEDETIALSPDELGNILEDVEEEPVEAEGLHPDEELLSEDSPVLAAESDSAPALEEREIINLDEYDEEPAGTPDAEASKQEGVAAAATDETALAPAATAVADTVAEAEGINKEEMRKMISYLDRLFDQLPEETIREFSKSEYFDLYKKIMTDLGL